MGINFFGLIGFGLTLAQLIVSLLGMRRRKKSTTIVLRMHITIKRKTKMDDVQRPSKRKR